MAFLRTLFVVFLLFFMNSFVLAKSPGKSGVVEFSFSGIKGKGFVLCALFDSPKTFLGKKAIARTRSILRNGKHVCRFLKVKPGIYGMGCFHDTNGNQKLDTGWFGIPKEGYAASNNARGVMGPPSWKKARFSFKGGLWKQTVRMKY